MDDVMADRIVRTRCQPECRDDKVTKSQLTSDTIADARSLNQLPQITHSVRLYTVVWRFLFVLWLFIRWKPIAGACARSTRYLRAHVLCVATWLLAVCVPETRFPITPNMCCFFPPCRVVHVRLLLLLLLLFLYRNCKNKNSAIDSHRVLINCRTRTFVLCCQSIKTRHYMHTHTFLLSSTAHIFTVHERSAFTSHTRTSLVERVFTNV